MYSNIVLRVFNNPANAGRISKPDGIADLYNKQETAHIEFSIRVQTGIITDCKFRAQANPYITAICSTITNMVKGKMVAMVFLDPYSIKEQLGDHADMDIMFCIDCFKMAIDDYKDKLSKQAKQNKSVEEQPETVIEPEEVNPVVPETNSTDEDDDFDFFSDEDF